MIYLFQFIDPNNTSFYCGYFTIVENKMDRKIVDRAIDRFNTENSMRLSMCDVESSNGRNIVKFHNTSIVCIIQRCDDDVKVKGSNLGYINLVSKYKLFNFNFKVCDSEFEYCLERADYDDNFCKCAFRLVDRHDGSVKHVIRYGEPFNDGFNTSINNKRIQVRFSDGNIRFRDIDINSIV